MSMRERIKSSLAHASGSVRCHFGTFETARVPMLLWQDAYASFPSSKLSFPNPSLFVLFVAFVVNNPNYAALPEFRSIPTGGVSDRIGRAL